MRIVNFLLAIMFLGFAFLQLNDPDPIIWILIYGVMSVFCVMAIFEFYPQKFLIATTAIYILYSLVFVPGVIDWFNSGNRSALFDDVAKMEYYYIEEAREFLGLFICIVVLVFYCVRSRKVRTVR
ncbi:transmembrane 220 family protein [Pseudochryseolinea flava]|uniref:Transmembrane family 220, helix n=1 Tax=Pseudochryseolinea flava TaxID=2059302 RepID=A0A364Y0C7_9BACT|nr:transmembrane 220 family protein [Pseudochryseolinea flava]RAW00252.1 hypothetical protein DQQ10_14420 [Pseudochryseolinea flava]